MKIKLKREKREQKAKEEMHRHELEQLQHSHYASHSPDKNGDLKFDTLMSGESPRKAGDKSGSKVDLKLKPR